MFTELIDRVKFSFTKNRSYSERYFFAFIFYGYQYDLTYKINMMLFDGDHVVTSQFFFKIKGGKGARGL